MAEKNKSAKSEVKRTRMMPAERIAKMEADLEAARKREQDKAAGKVGKVEERIAKLRKQRDELDSKIESAEQELAALQAQAGSGESNEEPAQPEQG